VSLTWVTVTDGNGVDFHALTATPEKEEGVTAFVFVDKKSGLGFGEGVTVAHDLKKYPGENTFGA
jgi:hypothetical protein